MTLIHDRPMIGCVNLVCERTRKRLPLYGDAERQNTLTLSSGQSVLDVRADAGPANALDRVGDEANDAKLLPTISSTVRQASIEPASL